MVRKFILQNKGICRPALYFLLVSWALCQSSSAGGSSVDYALCDIRVAYFYEHTDEIDWPTLYYLNDNFGCRIDLVRVDQRSKTTITTTSIPDKQLYSHTVYLPPEKVESFSFAIKAIFAENIPDIVIIGSHSGKSVYRRWLDEVKINKLDKTDLFDIANVFVLADGSQGGQKDLVIINAEELKRRYLERMLIEIPELFQQADPESFTSNRLVYYRLVDQSGNINNVNSGFLAGLKLIRLVDVAESQLPAGPIKTTFIEQTNKFISAFNASKSAPEKDRVELIVEGYRALLDMTRHRSFEQIIAGIDGLTDYLDEFLAKAEKAALDAVGLSWNGQIILRDTPHGPSLKYHASAVVDGPFRVILSEIAFHPYWDDKKVILDATERIIAPHQSFVREYFVEIDQAYLESRKPDSLTFTAQIAYSKIPLQITDRLPVWETPQLSVQFVPDFYFLPPVARLDVDRVVEPMNWQVVITKPKGFTDEVKLNLETPIGMFAGAYLQNLELDRGNARQNVRIPFTISNLFELGVQEATVTLAVNNQIVAADTGRIRVARCEIADTIKIGFLPDSTGLLEDVLGMTNAGYQPVTDKMLSVGNLRAFNTIIIGSGAFRKFESFHNVRDRFENYIRQGGSIIVFGQPEDWPLGALPASIVPSFELTTTDELTNRIPEARILSRPYKITETNLLSSFYRPREVASAVVTPGECVYVTASGATLLSVSRLGQGQIIYCGLPLLEMVSKLNIDAIHLFANVLNY